MLTKDYVDACHPSMKSQLAAYEALIAAANTKARTGKSAFIAEIGAKFF